MRRRKLAAIVLVSGMAFTMLAGCGASDTNADSAGQTAETGNDGQQAEEGAGQSAESGNTQKEDLKQAGLGGLTMLYDDSVWTEQPEQETESSLAFTDQNDSVLGISCSKESTYQHPLDMIAMSEQIYATYEGYEEVEAPSPVETQTQDGEWYEWVIRYVENGVPTISMQRFYAKNYYVYQMTYVAQEEAYESGKSEAARVMNSVVMNVPGNEDAEEKAKEFLVGTWSVGADSEGDKGYLVLKEDGTYEWYMEETMNPDNMHTGSYGCDVENATLGFAEGEGVYLALYPEALYVNGEQGMTGSAKYDYAFSLEQEEDGAYPMMNVTTFEIYKTYRLDTADGLMVQ